MAPKLQLRVRWMAMGRAMGRRDTNCPPREKARRRLVKTIINATSTNIKSKLAFGVWSGFNDVEETHV